MHQMRKRKRHGDPRREERSCPAPIARMANSLMKGVLFLCTANYYRSRFAEELFNHRAARARAGWQAQSRGLAVERGKYNVGPLSPLALRGLEERGVVAKGTSRFPLQCTVVDLEEADYIVALDDTEHRPLMRERFSGWEHRIQYWAIGDVGVVTPDHALRLIDERIDALLAELGTPCRSIARTPGLGRN